MFILNTRQWTDKLLNKGTKNNSVSFRNPAWKVYFVGLLLFCHLWVSLFFRGQMISAEDCEFISKFEVARSEDKQAILTKEGHQVDMCFLSGLVLHYTSYFI